MEPFEVSYKTTGKSKKKSRSVTCVLCPTVLAQKMGTAKPIFVEIGDVVVDWTVPVSQAYREMLNTMLENDADAYEKLGDYNYECE